MKVAINALSVTPGMTGIGCYTKSLLQSSLAHNSWHEYFYITGPDTKNLLPESRTDLCRIAVDRPDRFWEQLRLPVELRNRKIDVYHSTFFTCPIVREASNVITLHDAIPEVRPELCSATFLRFYRERIGPSLRAADYIVTTSEHARKDILQHLNVIPEKVHVLYQGIPEHFSPKNAHKAQELRRKLNLPDKYVLFVGMLDARKNLERLIEAFGHAAGDIPELNLILAGRKDDPAYALDKAIADSGVADRIRQLGYVADEDVPALYAGAHLFAFPSLYEGFGRPVVEAMASGVPVVASNTSSLPEITDGAAFLVDPEDTEELAEGISQLCQGLPLRKKLRDRGLLRAKEFTLERFGQRLLDLYNRIGRGG